MMVVSQSLMMIKYGTMIHNEGDTSMVDDIVRSI